MKNLAIRVTTFDIDFRLLLLPAFMSSFGSPALLPWAIGQRMLYPKGDIEFRISLFSCALSTRDIITQ